MSLIDGFEHIVRENESLAPFTWLRLGGPAQYFAEPTSHEELSALVCRCRDESLPVRLLGGGSNILVRDEGVPGLVLHLSAPAFCEIQVKDSTITAGGGTKLAHVISTAVREGLAGLEQLVGIPGTVGGALHGNSSSHVGDIGQWICGATVLTRSGEIIHRTSEELHFAYRHSSLDELVILNAKVELEQEDPRELTQRMQKLWILKRAGQPMGNPNVGYIFKSPIGDSAGSIIDQAGLKGMRQGGAEISDQHANYIIASSEATSRDVLLLIDQVREQVLERMGVKLEIGIEVW